VTEADRAALRRQIAEIDDKLYELQRQGKGRGDATFDALAKERMGLFLTLLPIPFKFDRKDNPTVRRQQDRKDIEACLLSTQVHDIECCNCPARERVESPTQRHAAQVLIELGWSYCSLKAAEMQGALCPACTHQEHADTIH
jgi:hypothetical protein